jgi:hypothetical protein
LYGRSNNALLSQTFNNDSDPKIPKRIRVGRGYYPSTSKSTPRQAKSIAIALLNRRCGVCKQTQPSKVNLRGISVNTLRRSPRILALAVASICLATTGMLDARVTRVTITSTTPVANTGPVGPYEQLRGQAEGEIDPLDRRNAVITDIALAPRTPTAKLPTRRSSSSSPSI